MRSRLTDKKKQGDIKKFGALAGAILLNSIVLAGLAYQAGHQSPQTFPQEVVVVSLSPTTHPAIRAAPTRRDTLLNENNPFHSTSGQAPTPKATNLPLPAQSPDLPAAPRQASPTTTRTVQSGPTPNQIDAETRRTLKGLLDCGKPVGSEEPAIRCSHDYARGSTIQLGDSYLTPEKRLAFEAAAQVQDAKRASQNGPLQELIVPCTGLGSNFGGGCLPANTPATGKSPEHFPQN